ncbi:PAC2 family protein [Microbacterium sp. LRZ72]|uniref:proteasome assembly chaperone family protein n=1 Tax=Microbacterium sp. LRZ72 TaxID=2942481 RepID=UPI0029AEFF56|nr:PAC2 family protein [Microbacterium sp. LRZ72]MDX2375331.1 PAC2 family protein [Microbacterium sp. LRZ72]
MPWTGDVFTPPAELPTIPTGLPLVVALTGFTDAGSAVSQVVDALRERIVSTPVALFANDAFLDYRARRPVISFDADHLSDYRPPRLEIVLASDEMGKQFLALTGYEPDFGWEMFVAAVIELAERYQIGSVTWVHAIAMPVPHTRPLGTTVSGNREELVEAHSVWRPHTQVPATVGHLLELRFSESGTPTASFVLLVPHYLADAEYPAAAIRALESITIASGLALPTEDLREANRDFLAKVDEQISANDELATMLQNLETRYDQYVQGSPLRAASFDDEDLPSADELAAELERYLATRPGDDDKRSR